MLYSLKGVVKEIIPPNKLILAKNFFNFEIFIPFNLVEIINQNFLEREVLVYIVCFLRKNEFLELYGFLEREERELFIKLNQLSKIGPKLALNLLSVFSPEALRKIIIEKDLSKLSKVPGIGPKRAEKLYLELKNLFLTRPYKGLSLPPEKERVVEEAKACLVSLGFQPKELDSLLLKILEEDDTLDLLIKKALKELAPKIKEEVFTS